MVLIGLDGPYWSPAPKMPRPTGSKMAGIIMLARRYSGVHTPRPNFLDMRKGRRSPSKTPAIWPTNKAIQEVNVTIVAEPISSMFVQTGWE